jgi:hypothetical protein
MLMLAERYRDEMYDFMGMVLREIGPRESCSTAERMLGERVAELWRSMGHDVRTHSFECHPKAFLGFIPLASLLYLFATVAYWRYPPVCVVLAGAALLMTILEIVRYREFTDPFFPKKEGTNVIGAIRPKGEIKRRVIVSAHLDSAYEFNLWFLCKNAALPIMLIAFIAPILPLLGGLAKLTFAGATTGPVFETLGWVCTGLCPIVALNLFFHTYRVVPGAGDDLAGIAVLNGVAWAFSENAGTEALALEHTEVLLLATSSEEAGLRGAKRYVAAFQDDLRALPTCGLFLDGVYDERFLTVVDRELGTGAKHDAQLVAMAQDIAKRHGWPMGKHMIPFGASDASAFAKAGIRSTCFLCQDVSRLVPEYHTRLDTLDRVRPQSLAVTLQLVLTMIERLDG